MNTDLRLFLVTARIECLFDHSYFEEQDDLRIVWATDTTDAQRKYEKLWSDCSEPGYKDYRVLSTVITPALM